MAEYDNRNRFTLFRNTRRREGKNDPHFNGTFTDADGREYWINAWSKEPKGGGEKFLSGDIKPKDEAAKAAPRASSPALDDAVPF